MKNTKNLDPVTGIQKANAQEKCYEFKKVAYKKDDVAGLIRLLKVSGYTASGKDAFDENGNHKGFKCSAKCRPDQFAWGHNKRLKEWVEERENIDPNGYHKTYLDCKDLDSCYKQIFGEALEEYNKAQTRKDKKIKNYLTHILQDQRRGKKGSFTADNSRKPMYEFVFQIGKRDNRLDTETSIAILESFVTEWLPKHYPNLVPIGIYLHADEYTFDSVTGQKLLGAVHVHFDFVPVCHALSKEEQEDEKKWKVEEKQKAIELAKLSGTEFNEKKFNAEWSKRRIERYGKALANGMKLQSSISGACNEMGFWTKGKLTAQIQMEEAIRNDLLDIVESYGIKVDREPDIDRSPELPLEQFKIREDNKAILKATKEIMEYNIQIEKQNQKVAEQNATDKEHNENAAKEISEKAEELSNLQKEVDAKKAETEKLAEDIEHYKKRIITLEEDESAVRTRENLVTKKEGNIADRLKDISKRSGELFKEQLAVNKRSGELDTRESDLNKKEDALYDRESELKKQQDDLNDRKKELEEMEKINSENALKNANNLLKVRAQKQDFEKVEGSYRVMKYTLECDEEIKLNIEKLVDQILSDVLNNNDSPRIAIRIAANDFKKKCEEIAFKYQTTIQCFADYLEGKTSADFRTLAYDMDKNHALSFDQYNQMKLDGTLDWQKKQKEEEIALKPVIPLRPGKQRSNGSSFER